MTKTYFSHFKTTTYSNNTVVDITERVVVKKKPTSLDYYPRDVSGVRPDNLAYQLYGDPYTSWIFYLTNNVIDPYYEWSVSDSEFDRYVELKYGSIANAMNTVAYYVNDWLDQAEVDPAAFDAMTPLEQDYWEPRYGYFNAPIAYARRRVNWTASTNFIIDVGIGTSNAVPFQDNEPIRVSYVPNSSGTGQVVESNSTSIVFQHVSGDAFPDANNGIVIGPNSFIYGVSSGACTSITSSAFIANCIAADVLAYYKPLKWYDIEKQTSSDNAVIDVLQPVLVDTMIQRVGSLLTSTNASSVVPG